jgi:adenine-specific DNA-methyltransferase
LGATAQNVYLVLYPKSGLASILRTDAGAIERVFEALGEVSKNLVVATGGRVYGGGLYKIEPKELEKVRLPGWLEEEFPSLFEFQFGVD